MDGLHSLRDRVERMLAVPHRQRRMALDALLVPPDIRYRGWLLGRMGPHLKRVFAGGTVFDARLPHGRWERYVVHHCGTAGIWYTAKGENLAHWAYSDVLCYLLEDRLRVP